MEQAKQNRIAEEEAVREREREAEAYYAKQAEEKAARKEAELLREQERQNAEAKRQADEEIRAKQYKAEEEWLIADQKAKMKEATEKLDKAGTVSNGPDGCFAPAEEFIKANMHNPASFQFVGMAVTYVVSDGAGYIQMDGVPAIQDNCYIHIYISYRGTNALGALVFERAHLTYNPSNGEMRIWPQ